MMQRLHLLPALALVLGAIFGATPAAASSSAGGLTPLVSGCNVVISSSAINLSGNCLQSAPTMTQGCTIFGCTATNPYPMSPLTNPVTSSIANCAGFSVGVAPTQGCSYPGTSVASTYQPSSVSSSSAGSAGGPPPLITKMCPGFYEPFPMAQNCPSQSSASTSAAAIAPPAQTPLPAAPPSSNTSTTSSPPTQDCYIGTNSTPQSLTVTDCFGQGGSLVPPLGSSSGPSSGSSPSSGPSNSASGSPSTQACYMPDGSSSQMAVSDCFAAGGSLLPPAGAPSSSSAGDSSGGASSP